VSSLASIIVPCFNQRDFTRSCLQSLFRYTRAPWELIVVDNGSTDDTKSYLAGVQDATAVPGTLVTNAHNLGFPAAINQGLRLARGEYLVLLNNDVVVTDGWLDQLTALVTARTRPTAENGKEDGEGKAGIDLTAETAEAAETKTKTENRNLTIIDLNEVGAEIASNSTRGSLPSPPVPPLGGPCSPRGDPALRVHPPWPPPRNGGKICSPSDGVASLGTTSEATRHGQGRGGSTIGLVGPMSNYAAPPQLVEEVPYLDLKEMQVFARRWREQHRGQWFTVPKLSGFCLLMKRAVYDAIGGLDERFGLGLFDDDDLAERARRAGFELAVAHDLFIHHFGSRTFAGNRIDAEALLDENAPRIAAKWGLPQTPGRRVVLRPFTDRPQMTRNQTQDGSDPQITLMNADENTRLSIASNSQTSTTDDLSNGSVSIVSPSFHLCPSASSADDNRFPSVNPESIDRSSHPRRFESSATKKATVSLTMIVRDEENNLSHSLGSVAGLFDEIVVVDTGSTDRTVEIARSLGARVFDFVWVDDFAAARNASLARATGDYAFWLDADDVLDPTEREKLRALLDRLRAGDVAAHVMRCACDPSPDGSGGETVVDHVRLFPLRDGIRWTYRVHEQIMPALRRAKVPVRWTNIAVRHTGYVDAVLRDRKLDRNIRILREELEDRPDDPFILFNLGASAVERHDWPEALRFLQRSLTGSAPADSITRKLFALIARVHQMAGDLRQALRTCEEGLKLDHDDAELWFRKGMVHRNRGESREAEGCWRRILTLHRPDQFCSVDQGIYGHRTRRNLAVLAAERGDHAEAAKLWAEILAECPGDPEALAKVAGSRRLGVASG